MANGRRRCCGTWRPGPRRSRGRTGSPTSAHRESGLGGAGRLPHRSTGGVWRSPVIEPNAGWGLSATRPVARLAGSLRNASQLYGTGISHGTPAAGGVAPRLEVLAAPKAASSMPASFSALDSRSGQRPREPRVCRITGPGTAHRPANGRRGPRAATQIHPSQVR